MQKCSFSTSEACFIAYVALSSNLIQMNLIERIKCDGSASYETN